MDELANHVALAAHGQRNGKATRSNTNWISAQSLRLAKEGLLWRPSYARGSIRREITETIANRIRLQRAKQGRTNLATAATELSLHPQFLLMLARDKVITSTKVEPHSWYYFNLSKLKKELKSEKVHEWVRAQKKVPYYLRTPAQELLSQPPFV